MNLLDIYQLYDDFYETDNLNILKRIISIKLIGIFFGVVGLSILLTGYTLNYLVG
jgi:uncharacterized membrane protein YraQ (UPF0718 family)